MATTAAITITTSTVTTRGIRAFALSSDEPVGKGAFDMFLDLLRSAHGPKLLGSKGSSRSPKTPSARS